MRSFAADSSAMNSLLLLIASWIRRAAIGAIIDATINPKMDPDSSSLVPKMAANRAIVAR